MQPKKKRKKSPTASKEAVVRNDHQLVQPKKPLSAAAAKREAQEEIGAEMAAVRRELLRRELNRAKKKQLKAIGSVSAGSWRRPRPFVLPPAEPTVFEKLWQGMQLAGTLLSDGAQWLVKPFASAKYRRLHAAEEAHELEYVRALACKRLLKKLPADDRLLRSFIQEALAKSRESLPETMLAKSHEVAKLHARDSKKVEALLIKSSTSGAMGIFDRMERRILEREQLAGPILEATGELNAGFYKISEQQIIKREKETAAMEAILAKIPALEIDKLSDEELETILPDIRKARRELESVHTDLQAEEDLLDLAEDAATAQTARWKKRADAARTVADMLLAEQAAGRADQFAGSIEKLSRARAELKDMTPSVDEKIARLKDVEKEILARLKNQSLEDTDSSSYKTFELKIIEREKQAAAIEEVLAQIPPFEMDKLSEAELQSILPGIQQAMKEFADVHADLRRAGAELQKMHKQTEAQVATWQLRAEMAANQKNRDLEKQALQRRAQFIETAEKQALVKISFDKLTASFDEKIARLDRVEKIITEKLSAP